MEAEHKVGAVQLSARLRDVSRPVIRRLRIAEQSCLAESAALQVSFGWSDQHPYTLQIRGCKFGDRPSPGHRACTRRRPVDIPLAAFGFDIGDPCFTSTPD